MLTEKKAWLSHQSLNVDFSFYWLKTPPRNGRRDARKVCHAWDVVWLYICDIQHSTAIQSFLAMPWHHHTHCYLSEMGCLKGWLLEHFYMCKGLNWIPLGVGRVSSTRTTLECWRTHTIGSHAISVHFQVSLLQCCFFNGPKIFLLYWYLKSYWNLLVCNPVVLRASFTVTHSTTACHHF